MLVRKAEATRERLVFIVQALKSLFADDDLMALLQAEGMDTLPKNLALRMQGMLTCPTRHRPGQPQQASRARIEQIATRTI